MARLEVWQDGSKINSLNMGECDPGDTVSQDVDIKNVYTAAIESVMARVFPEKENQKIKSGSNIMYAHVIRADTQNTLQKVSVVKESASALTEKQDRGKCYLWNGVNFTDYSSGNVMFPADSSSKLYIGVDEKCPNLLAEFLTPGSYSGFKVSYSNGDYDWDNPSGWTEITGTEGTSGTAADGEVVLAEADVAAWEKITVNTKKMYWFEVSCTGVTIQAEADVLYWAYVYDLPHHCLVDTGSYYLRSDDATPLYSLIASGYIEYPGVGMIAFYADPLALNPTYSIVAEYNYKVPQEATYELDYPSALSCRWRKDGGAWSSAIGITPDGETEHTDIIQGFNFLFRASINTSETTLIEIGAAARYIWIEGENKDYSAGTINSGDTSSITVEYKPPISVSAVTNTNAIQLLLHKAS